MTKRPTKRKRTSIARKIRDRDGHGNCYYCGKKDADTIEHLIPIKRNWENLNCLDNLVLACGRCNQKADKRDSNNNLHYRAAGLRGAITNEVRLILIQKVLKLA